MSTELADIVLRDFIRNSWPCIEVMVKELTKFKETEKPKTRLFQFRNQKGNQVSLDNSHFFLRASVEYSNPQVTLEEVQGIIAARLLEVCGTYFSNYGLHRADDKDIGVLLEMLGKASEGTAVSFLLNTDDVEPDRYSANPLKESIVNSGQSAFPAANVKTNELRIDQNFVRKYDGVLISKDEVELITRRLGASNNSYVDMVDAVKYEQLENLSASFGINLCINSLRLPLEMLKEEDTSGLMHHIVSEVHTDFDSVERAYNCMGRSMKSRTTLLTVPHSAKGYGSKRAAKGKIYFEGSRLKEVRVDYRTTPLYENEVDPHDISVAKADDSFTVNGERFINYSFKETPSSPQFILYSLGSPENVAIWHGIGVFAPPQLLKSYKSMRLACARESFIKGLKEEYGITMNLPVSFNLLPSHMWAHPLHRNIDASVGSVASLKDLAKMGMRLEHLSTS